MPFLDAVSVENRPLPKWTILVVEDESLVAADLEERLERLGYGVCGIADTCETAVSSALAMRPDLVLMDIHLIGNKDGIEAATLIRRSSSIPVVFLTAHADNATLSRISPAEPFGYVLKPFDERELKATIEVALLRSQAEDRLRKMERWFASTLGSIGDGVIATDMNGKIRFINANAERFTGWLRSVAMGRDVSEIFLLEMNGEPLSISSLFDEAIRLGSAIHLEDGHSLKRRSGRKIPVGDSISAIRDDEGRVTGWVIIFRDLTTACAVQNEKKRIQEKMQEAQRMESLGVLAGGIAHDFNNLLQVIVLNAALSQEMAEKLPGEEAEGITEMLKAIEEASAKATNLCSQMLAYAGHGRFAVKDLELSDFIRRTVKHLEGSIGKSIELNLDLEENLPLIHADVSQLQQIITNLITNASDALGENSGSIRVETKLFQANKDFLSKCRMGEELPEGTYVLLKISDTGCGMNPETLSKIFDLFFSTKFQGRGLGLAAVMGIVKAHEGGIQVTSALGEGTIFHVLFKPLKTTKVVNISNSPRKKSSGRVLLVDDEPAIRMAGKTMLRHMGYEVDVGCDGLEAIEKVRARGGDYRFVLMDMTMPNLTGPDTFKLINEQFPALAVIMMSGYSSDIARNSFNGASPSFFIHKPFTPDDLNQLLPSIGSVVV